MDKDGVSGVLREIRFIGTTRMVGTFVAILESSLVTTKLDRKSVV